jgi:hypothetical protein
MASAAGRGVYGGLDIRGEGALSEKKTRQQQARERVAQLRAQEAKRRQRRLWLAGIGGAVVLAGAATGIALAVSGHQGSPATSPSIASTPKLRLGSLSSLGTLSPAPSQGPVGPEGVSIPSAASLAGLSAAAKGQPVDGIRCNTSEQLVFHIHAHLTIFINGVQRAVPAGIGIPGATFQNTPQGQFVGSGSCFYWLHTHAASGVIHIESPVHRTYTLGNFFDEWGQPLGPSQVGPVKGHVVAIYNGKLYQGDPRDIPLNAHAQIQLEIGTPLVAPVSITWPKGL